MKSQDDLVDSVLKDACFITQSEACTLFLPDQSTRELLIHSSRGKNEAINAFRIPWDSGIAGRVFQDRKLTRIDDALHDPRVLQLDDGTGFVTRSMLCAPLTDKYDCVGVLQVLNPTDRPVFTQLDEDIFEGLTIIVTGALIRFDHARRSL